MMEVKNNRWRQWEQAWNNSFWEPPEINTRKLRENVLGPVSKQEAECPPPKRDKRNKYREEHFRLFLVGWCESLQHGVVLGI